LGETSKLNGQVFAVLLHDGNVSTPALCFT
jgi:hypothetical protein